MLTYNAGITLSGTKNNNWKLVKLSKGNNSFQSLLMNKVSMRIPAYLKNLNVWPLSHLERLNANPEKHWDKFYENV